MNLLQFFPHRAVKFLEPDGTISRTWWDLLRSLWIRTGSQQGGGGPLLDSIGSVQGDILYRGSVTWTVLAPGTVGQALLTGGPAANPSWGTPALAAIPAGDLLANLGGAPAAPVGVTLTALFDNIFGTVRGDLLFRSAVFWSSFPPGTNRKVLVTQGPGQDPIWDWDSNVQAGINAAGNSQGTATVLAADINEVATVGAGQGVILFAVPPGRSPTVVINAGANALSVYPAVGSHIDALANNAPYNLPVGKSQLFWAVTATHLYSTQLG